MNTQKSNINLWPSQTDTAIRHFDYKAMTTRQLFSLATYALKSRHLTAGQRMRLIFACQFACESR